MENNPAGRLVLYIFAFLGVLGNFVVSVSVTQKLYAL